MINGVSLFAYGRLLGSAYYAWGLLPDSYNPGYPGSPADYFCGNGDATRRGGVVPAAERGARRLVVWFFRHNFTQTEFKCSQLGSARQPFALRGQASKVGVPGDTGLVFIDTTVTETGPIDLSAARLVVDQVLMEADRAGELVRDAGGSPFLPLELTAARGSRPNRATFKTPPGARPIVTVEVTNRDVRTGRLAVSLTVNRAALPQTAEGCEAGATALLRTRFVLDDRVHPPVSFNVEQPWTCNRSRLATP